jgi:hypothetical protein
VVVVLCVVVIGRRREECEIVEAEDASPQVLELEGAGRVARSRIVLTVVLTVTVTFVEAHRYEFVEVVAGAAEERVDH